MVVLQSRERRQSRCEYLELIIRTRDVAPIDYEEVEKFIEALRDSHIPILVESRDWARIPDYFQRNILNQYEVLFSSLKKLI